MPYDKKIGALIENRWEIHDIKQGGMGVVYIVFDNVLSEPLAAKTFRDEVFELHPTIADRFQEEALLWLNLDIHPNIVQAKFVHKIDGRPYLFLEYVSGGDLRSLIGKRQLMSNLPLMLKFAIQFCDGMTHAISKGLGIHRDIKPRNCLITQNRNLKITDFGLARAFEEALEEDAAKKKGNGGLLWRLFGGKASDKKRMKRPLIKRPGQKTPTVTSVGSPPFMAPELFDSASAANIKTDIYSTGVMLYQMVTARLPFWGSTTEELAWQHKTKPFPPLPDHLPKSLKMAIQTCLAKDPEKRFNDFVEIRGLLVKAYEDVSGRTAPYAAHGKELDAEQWHNKGLSLAALKHHKEALQCFEKALETDPKYETAWLAMGELLGELGRAEEAVDCFTKAAGINPHNDNAWDSKGRMLLEIGHFMEAAECFDRTLDLRGKTETFFTMTDDDESMGARTRDDRAEYDPELEKKRKLETTWRNKGRALLSLGRNEEALECFNAAIESNPSDAKAWHNVGQIYGRLGKLDDEIKCYDKAIEIDPNFFDAWNSKGLTLSRSGMHHKAFDCFEGVLRRNPRYEQALYNKGAVLVKLGWFEQAVICFDSVIALNKNYSDAWMGKGYALVALDDRQAGVECFRRAGELGETDATAAVEKYSREKDEAGKSGKQDKKGKREPEDSDE